MKMLRGSHVVGPPFAPSSSLSRYRGTSSSAIFSKSYPTPTPTARLPVLLLPLRPLTTIRPPASLLRSTFPGVSRHSRTVHQPIRQLASSSSPTAATSSNDQKLHDPSGRPHAIHLKDYLPPPYLVDQVDLTFDLGEEECIVQSKLAVRQNLEYLQRITERRGQVIVANPHRDAIPPLVLDGGKPNEVDLLEVVLDGRKLDRSEYRVDQQTGKLHLSALPSTPESFVLETRTSIKPHLNTALEGLYKSNNIFCTQCEAEGFRRITYFFDRPDVMSAFTTKIIADKKKYPVLLSNGDMVEQGDEKATGRHWAIWKDPFRKPSYLFALVAGDLPFKESTYTTAFTKKPVKLRIYTEAENIDRVEHAMLSLKRAMQWDEVTFGLEYDLSTMNIVAVNDFNMGAMENKGLNIFNSKYIVADRRTATDDDFVNIERVVAHEYFHNWTGNRVTLRDWFQLSLKEGLTVFRDQQFSGDMNSAGVQRINEVVTLRAAQFREDRGPMAHPVRPESFIDISNFYTTTVYEKGAELVRMVHTLLGQQAFCRGLRRYLYKFDGKGATVEDFLGSMEEAGGHSLSQFARWYHQSGTPEVTLAASKYDPVKKALEVTFSQRCPSTPHQPEESKLPFHIPISMALLGSKGPMLEPELGTEHRKPSVNGNGQHQETREPGAHVLELREKEQTFRFVGVPQKPVLSLLRGFSAPVKLHANLSKEDLCFIAAKDTDPFCRWEALSTLSHNTIVSLIDKLRKPSSDSKAATLTLDAVRGLSLDAQYIEAFDTVLEKSLKHSTDKSMDAFLLAMPTESFIGQSLPELEVEAIHVARRAVKVALGRAVHDRLRKVYEQNHDDGVVSEKEKTGFDSAAKGRRDLKNMCLDLLMHADGAMGYGLTVEVPDVPAPAPSHRDAFAILQRQLQKATTMTDTLACLRILTASAPHKTEAQQHLDQFYERWRNDPLVVNKWLGLQSTSPILGSTIKRVNELLEHQGYRPNNPNDMYVLIGGFSANLLCFHGEPNAQGYAFLTQRVREISKSNPQVAARLLRGFGEVNRVNAARRKEIVSQLRSLTSDESLPREVYEVASLCLQAAGA